MKYISFIITLALVGCAARQGPQGNPGVAGPQGVPGIAAQPCTVAPSANGAIITCPDNSQQEVTNGTNGVDGKDANNVTTVQFCADQGTTTYPSKFPEYGIVINDMIYAVYWNGSSAWLAQTVPGTYESTATGLNCTFTVNDDGSITED